MNINRALHIHLICLCVLFISIYILPTEISQLRGKKSKELTGVRSYYIVLQHCDFNAMLFLLISVVTGIKLSKVGDKQNKHDQILAGITEEVYISSES